MNERLPLFDRVFAGPATPPKPRLTGEDLRDSGIESVLSHTPQDYKNRFVEAVKSFPVGQLITTEDIRERAGELPLETHHNAIGGLMQGAKKEGLIVATNESRNAKRPSLHARRLLVWRRV